MQPYCKVSLSLQSLSVISRADFSLCDFCTPQLHLIVTSSLIIIKPHPFSLTLTRTFYQDLSAAFISLIKSGKRRHVNVIWFITRLRGRSSRSDFKMWRSLWLYGLFWKASVVVIIISVTEIISVFMWWTCLTFGNRVPLTCQACSKHRLLARAIDSYH